MTDEEQLPLSEEPNTPEPTLAETLAETAGQKLVDEVSSTNITAPKVESIKALLAVYQTAQQFVREEGWEKQRGADMNVMAEPMPEPAPEEVVEEAEVVDDEPTAEKPKKKKSKKEKKV